MLPRLSKPSPTFGSINREGERMVIKKDWLIWGGVGLLALIVIFIIFA